MLVLAWTYLTGRAVATDPSDRQRPEWPPHPDRVFQALVAAWGGLGESAVGATALSWLAGLPAPHLAVSTAEPAAMPKVFVPVNDVESNQRVYGDPLISLLPERRMRKERFFPAVQVEGRCALIWPEVELSPEHGVALATLCAGVTNIGHSSSLVRMWVESQPVTATLRPALSGEIAEAHLRVPDADRLTTLQTAYARSVQAAAARPGSPIPLPPRAATVGYITVDQPGLPRGDFDQRWIVLRRDSGDRWDLPQTLAVTTALRDTLNKHVSEPLRPLVSGHPPGSAAPATDVPHLAVIPLADVGHGHADGHLLGLALVLPARATDDEREGVWQALRAAVDPTTGYLRLTAGAIGAWNVSLDAAPVPAKSLHVRRWCKAHADWATVTPIVLDRHPPKRHSDLDAWTREQIAASIARQGLPQPLAVQVLGTSAHLGAPTARAMPAYRRKDGGTRWHVHARIIFAAPIAGPLLLGAGRYRGYGLCAPFTLSTGG